MIFAAALVVYLWRVPEYHGKGDCHLYLNGGADAPRCIHGSGRPGRLTVLEGISRIWEIRLQGEADFHTA